MPFSPLCSRISSLEEAYRAVVVFGPEWKVASSAAIHVRSPSDDGANSRPTAAAECSSSGRREEERQCVCWSALKIETCLCGQCVCAVGSPGFAVSKAAVASHEIGSFHIRKGQGDTSRVRRYRLSRRPAVYVGVIQCERCKRIPCVVFVFTWNT